MTIEERWEQRGDSVPRDGGILVLFEMNKVLATFLVHYRFNQL